MKENVPDKKWVDEIALKNGVKPEDVLKYINAISSGKRVIHHLSLV